MAENYLRLRSRRCKRESPARACQRSYPTIGGNPVLTPHDPIPEYSNQSPRMGAARENVVTQQVVLGPDIYVNASVALGSPPEQVARRVLREKASGAATEWILTRVRDMLARVPGFKDDAVASQLELIRGLVHIVSDSRQHGPDAWKDALVSAAKTAGVHRVVTDHPDLLQLETSDGVEFMSSEAWLLEAATPPPPPSTRH
jgi:hypothetical protein